MFFFFLILFKKFLLDYSGFTMLTIILTNVLTIVLTKAITC